MGSRPFEAAADRRARVAPPPGSTSHRFENVDLLRGIAALLVVWLHAGEVFVELPGIAAHGTGLADIADLLNVGRIGVIAFFAISGYVIVPTITGPRLEGIRDFLIKRLLRLYPAFWAAMAMASVTGWWLIDRPLSATTVAANATMLPLEFGAPQIMGHFWTLEVELIFYGIVIVLFAAGHLHRQRTIAILGIALSVAWPILFKSAWGRALVDHNLVWTFLSYFLTVMFWGAMLRARTLRGGGEGSGSRLRDDWPYIVVTALVFGRPVLALLFGSPTVHQEDWRGTFLGLLLFLAFLRIPARGAAALTGLGTISYSLYLFHPAVFYPMFRFVASRPAWSEAPLWTYVVASMAASIACAALSYRLIEAPCNRLARRWIERIGPIGDHPVGHRATSR